MKHFSIIIPVYNEAERIAGLLESINILAYSKSHYEVIVVNDGSTDQTDEIIQRFTFAKLISLPENKGRFLARKTGVEAAKYENLLFLDARSIVDENALNVLNNNEKYNAIIGHSFGVDNPNAFETFYGAIRKKFQKTDKQSIVELNKKNFDKYSKGMGVLFVKKNLFLEACNTITAPSKALSDDTKILNFIVERETIAIDPSLRIVNFSRSSFTDSIKHLFNRGIKFVDYYLDIRKRHFWIVIFLPPILFFIFFAILANLHINLSIKILSTVCLYLILTLSLSNSKKSFPKLIWISPLIILTFYSGVFWGIILKLFKIGER